MSSATTSTRLAAARTARQRTSANVTCVGGYFGGSPYLNGVDLNGDGDTLDQVTVLTPSQTRTRRYAVVAGLAYEINTGPHRSRHLHARLLESPSDGPGWLREGEWRAGRRLPGQRSDRRCRRGVDLQKRDRQSYAILDKVAAQYRGQFGTTAPRRSVQACRTSSATWRTSALPRRPAASLNAAARTVRSMT